MIFVPKSFIELILILKCTSKLFENASKKNIKFIIIRKKILDDTLQYKII